MELRSGEECSSGWDSGSYGNDKEGGKEEHASLGP